MSVVGPFWCDRNRHCERIGLFPQLGKLARERSEPMIKNRKRSRVKAFGYYRLDYWIGSVGGLGSWESLLVDAHSTRASDRRIRERATIRAGVIRRDHISALACRNRKRVR